MSDADPRLELATAPFLSEGLSTPRVMFEVVGAALVVVAVSAYYFGVSALLVVACATGGALLTEAALRAPGSPLRLGDGSAALTGILLGLTLPPAMPLWMAFLGGVVAIGLGKTIWGGLGHNVFNPALVGRAFLQAAFPTVITTWTPPGGGFWEIQPSTVATPLMHAEVDVVSTATPLGLSKFEGHVTDAIPLLVGDTAGSLGETAAVVLIACGLWLGVRRVFDWRLPISTLLSVAALSTLLHLAAPDRFPGAEFMLLSGGLLFAAVFMVTDPVTTPLSPKGAWIFGAGVGALVVVIRLFGGLPEGVMYAVLLMNSVTPLIDRYTRPTPFGGGAAS